MNILVSTLAIDPSRGGIQTHAYEVSKSLTQAGDNVIVLSAQAGNSNGFGLSLPFRLYRLWPFRFPWWPLTTLISIFNHIYLVLRHKIQAILVTHWDINGLAAWTCWKLLSVPYCVTAHAREIRDPSASRKDRRLPLRLRCMVTVLRGARRVLAVSHYTRQRLIGAGMPGECIKVIPNGVDVQRFSTSPNRDALRTIWQLTDARIILTVGRLVRRKGHNVAIRALPQILDHVPQAIYLIGGKGPEEKRLRHLAKEVSVSDRVRFLGHVSYEDLPDLYRLADVFLMPCREIVEGNRIDAEGFGIVFLEAAACGCPVVAGQSGGTEDAVVDGETGLLVDPFDVHAVAAATIRLLTDKDLATRLGTQGQARVEQEFTWTRTATAIRETLKHILENNVSRT